MPLQKQFACERCFGYSELRDQFGPTTKKSSCFWCGARSVKILPLGEFGDEFRNVVSELYEPADRGESIDQLLLSDWPRILGRRFQKKTPDFRRSFLVAILEAGMSGKELHTEGVDYRGFFSRKPTELVDRWQDKIESIVRGGDRAFGEALNTLSTVEDVPSQLEVALEDLSCEIPSGSVFFRARIHTPSTRADLFGPSNLGAPPPEKARPGRVNRLGQPVLYLASDPNTAIAEVRAFKGAAVAVGNVRLTRDLRLIDTTEFGRPKTPFGYELLKWKKDLSELFGRFGWELSRPILPEEQERGYAPTQHLAEFMHQCGYSGIKYPSAMGAGHNVVLFDPIDGNVETVSYHRVRAVLVSKRPLEPYEAPYDENPYDYLFHSSNVK